MSGVASDRSLEVAHQIDAIQQRSGEAASVAREVGFATAASLDITGKAARARIGGAYEHEARRVQRRVPSPDDCYATVLERLAQRLEGRTRELGELVQQKHAEVSQHDLANPAWPCCTHHPSRGDRVMRCAKRPASYQFAACVEACDALDP